MKIVHSRLGKTEPQPKKLTKKEQFEAEMEVALRRRRYANYLTALKKQHVIELIKEAQKVCPGWMPKFKG